ncbi:MAG: Lon protease family protein [Candidatus Heimdallarchaeota archaeon]|nr:Lon protease family protein [Candidatus Heimdallarchaeota archaeon]
MRDIEDTFDIPIPKDPLRRIIGQDFAIKISRMAAAQRRNLLLIGPPGIGKSMIAQALSFHLGQPTEEIWIVHNPENPERPFFEVKQLNEIRMRIHQRTTSNEYGELIPPQKAPFDVAVKLGYACENCKNFSIPETRICPHCNKSKIKKNQSRFGDLLSLSPFTAKATDGSKVSKAIQLPDGREEILLFEEAGNQIRVFDQKAIELSQAKKGPNPMKVLVPIRRSLFVQATGASITELLGDCLHDPYGGHHKLGTPPYKRVVAGAIHEAHQGVLFIDEISQLGNLQRSILTAMQERRFPIIGRNSQSSGASVRVDNVPCDFVLVAACNLADLPSILPPLRSRIQGDGYEVLLKTTMPDNEPNRLKLIQFISQEILRDNKIPAMDRKGIFEVIKYARIIAEQIDNEESSLTLRLRELAGLIKVAGDIAIINREDRISIKHVRAAIEIAKPLEDQIIQKYGSYENALKSEKRGFGIKKEKDENLPQNLWNG